ncbi:MAG TPA: sensor histidine kinase KdpD, partial [Hypericibacter adhaerens]|uniref:sensor histidine kinase KdpD n=1 Tax=Hypericibacter adhaerens TaxID=2602016 RepID=UPI002CDC7B45
MKIFLGAAPGVGKTYAMLQEAAIRARQGVDVLVGLVETHGRAETDALMRGLPVLPRRRLAYRGQELEELDLDALLVRRPALALIDELAHTNVPGARHLKRWQDVIEVLDAGIDVVTTLNIQHIESLNDAVARITGVRVQETVPDAVVARADDIELIDLPPEELIARLRDGRVYRAGTVGRALDNFFTRPNLTALRELALRTAATRVDQQMLSLMAQGAVKGPWPTQERILVCINESPLAKSLVRAGKRMADRADIPWIVATVVTLRHEALPESARRMTAEALQLAEALGAETVTVHAHSDVAGEIIALARARNATRLLLGRPRPRPWWAFRFGEGVTGRLLDAARDFEVTLVAGDAPAPPPRRRAGPRLGVGWEALLAGVAGAAAATLIAWPIDALHLVSPTSLVVIYMVAVLLVGARYGLWPAIVTSVLCFLAHNWFYTAPRYSFTIQRPEDVVGIVLFLMGAIVTGTLAGRLRAQVTTMRNNQKRTEMLYDFAKRIAAKSDLDDVLYAGAYHIAATLDCRSLILMPGASGALEQVQGYPAIEEDLDPRAVAAARWAFEKNEFAGAGTPTLPASEWMFAPLAAATPLGVVGLQFKDPRRGADPELRRLLKAVEDQVAVAIERTRLAADLQALQIEAEGEKLRTALLNSLSHDLRTPLVSVIGALSGLGGDLDEAGRRALIETGLDEARRLDRYVQNLLNMTRIEYGALRPRRSAVDLRELIGSARSDLSSVLAGRNVIVNMPTDIPQLDVDPVLIGQALVNVLENAAKYSPPGSAIRVSAAGAGDRVSVGITDEGPGIPPGERERVFDLFYR